MEHVEYTQDGVNYNYYRITPVEMFKTIRTNKRNIKPWSTNYQYVSSTKLKDYKQKLNYKMIHASFDIETTSINGHSYMYVWQFGFITKGIQYVCKGRTWLEFENVMRGIVDRMNTKDRVIVWVHNLQGYEFQFLRGRYHNNISNVFAKENNHPIKFNLFDKLEFRDSMSLCPKGLQGLAEDYCVARKLKGDLDYNILRNSSTPLTETEERYCDNDVIILSQFSEFVYKNLIINNRIPLTQTGILRSEINKYIDDNGLKEVKRKVHFQFPSQRLYKLMMNYLFKGGLSNAMFTNVHKIMYDLDSYDFTSSYPSIMLQDRYYFPSEFKRVNVSTMEEFVKMSKEYCVCAIFRFTNIHAKTKHNIISKSKCIELENDLTLNGRVRYASKLTTFETEIDIECYNMFYEWEKVEILGCYRATRVQMPDYIRVPLLNAYILKSKLKKEGKPYAVEKAKANSCYGMMVQRLIEGEWEYNCVNDDFTNKPQNDYNKQIRGKFILPQVGVYITAWARYNLLCGIYAYKDNTYLYDTDSIKGHFVDETYMNSYNDMMIRYNKILSNKYNIPFEYVNDLGCWDCETSTAKYERFLTLGAKRYIYTQGGEFKQTVAGLGKHALYDTCYKELYGKLPEKINGKIQYNDVKTINKCFDTFDNEMYIYDAEKLQHIKFEHVTDNVNGEVMEEYSGVYLCQNDFTLRMNGIFESYILAYQSDETLEKRL